MTIPERKQPDDAIFVGLRLGEEVHAKKDDDDDTQHGVRHTAENRQHGCAKLTESVAHLADHRGDQLFIDAKTIRNGPQNIFQKGELFVHLPAIPPLDQCLDAARDFLGGKDGKLFE